MHGCWRCNPECWVDFIQTAMVVFRTAVKHIKLRVVRKLSFDHFSVVSRYLCLKKIWNEILSYGILTLHVIPFATIIFIVGNKCTLCNPPIFMIEVTMDITLLPAKCRYILNDKIWYFIGQIYKRRELWNHLELTGNSS